MKRRIARLAAPLLLAAFPAAAQITTVPMKGVDNEWVKQLDLRGRMDWEWIETYPEQVYFATRHDSSRKGDIVTMWTRIEYKYPHHPLDHRSAVSRDDWDCKNRTRSTAGPGERWRGRGWSGGSASSCSNPPSGARSCWRSIGGRSPTLSWRRS